MIDSGFGDSNIRVSKLGLGLAALGRPGYINLGHGLDLDHNYDVAVMENTAHQILDIAYHQGIRYFDVARSYGRAEEFLGSWINGKEDIVIGSKWGYTYTADWKVETDSHEVKSHTIEVLDRQIEETRTNLGTHLNIYHIHSATPESGVLTNQQVLDRLWQLKENGLIIGLSTSGPSQAETIEASLEVKMGSQHLFGSVQTTWNVLEQSASNALQKANDAGYCVIIKEALANGRLTARNTNNYPALDVLKSMASECEVKMDAIAIAFAIHQPWVSCVLSGAVLREHLLSNLKALTVQFSKNQLDQLSHLSEAPDSYWKHRSELKWN